MAQSLKVWAVEARLPAGHDNGTVATAGDALAAVHRLDQCHGQPGAVFSAHEVLDGTEPNCT